MELVKPFNFPPHLSLDASETLYGEDINLVTV